MAVNSVDQRERTVTVISYNMHGFNQGCNTIQDLINSLSPDIFMTQESWLTPANMYKINENFPAYCGYGISAMADRVEAGPLVGADRMAV